MPHPQPLPAEHLALPGSAGGHASPECGANPGGGVRCRPHTWRNPGSHRFWWIFNYMLSSFSLFLAPSLAFSSYFHHGFFFKFTPPSVASTFVLSYPLTTQCAFCFPALIRLFFTLCPSHRLSQGCLFCLPAGWLPLSASLFSSHCSNAHHYISIILSSSVFNSSSLSPRSLDILPCHDQASWQTRFFLCVCVCVLTWFPLCTCFSGDCVCLCVTLPCHNITGPTDALSSHKPFLSATLSLCPHTPPPLPHTQTHNLLPPLQVPDSCLD